MTYFQLTLDIRQALEGQKIWKQTSSVFRGQFSSNWQESADEDVSGFHNIEVFTIDLFSIYALVLVIIFDVFKGFDYYVSFLSDGIRGFVLYDIRE